MLLKLTTLLSPVEAEVDRVVVAPVALVDFVLELLWRFKPELHTQLPLDQAVQVPQ